MGKKKKDNKIIINRYSILVGFLILLTFILLVIITILNKNNKDIEDKITKLDNISNEILILKDNYNVLNEIDEKIWDISNKNDLVNKEINNLTSSIKEYDRKIALYNK